MKFSPTTRQLTGRRLFGAVVIAFAAGCVQEVADPSAEDADIIGISIQPRGADLSPNDSLAFEAQAIMSTGATAPTTVLWEATGGSIDGAGFYRAPAEAGTYQIVATHTVRTWLSDTVAATVAAVSPAPVASVDLTPSTAALVAGGTVRLTATPRDSAGTPLTGRTATWTSDDDGVATVDAGGLVSGIAAGATTVWVTVEGHTASASITVSDVAVASVEVAPASANLTVGQTVQLTATARDANGNVLSNRPVSWVSTNTSAATVDGGGLVQGVGAGSATITATVEGQSDGAAITVTGGGGAPTDTLFADDFEAGTLSHWDDIFSTQAGNYSVIQDGSIADGGTGVLRIFYPAGARGAGAMSKFVTPGDRVYARMRMRFSAGWQGNTKFMLIRGSPTRWGSYGVGGQCPDGTDFVLVNGKTHNGSPGVLRLYSYFVDMAPAQTNPPVCWGNHGLASEDPGAGPTPLATYHQLNHVLAVDQWHTMELEVQLNTVGQRDGWQRLWANGTLIAEWTGVRWRTANAVLLQAFTLENSRGSRPSQDQILYVDNVLVTTRRP